MIKAYIFDVDGTLSETEDVHLQAFNETFVDYELDWHWSRELYRDLLKVTGGKERMRHYIETYGPPDGLKALAQIAQMHQHKTVRYTRLIERGAVELRPGVKKTLEAAKESGIRLAIATTTSLPNVEALLKATFDTERDDIFEVIAAGDEVTSKKPAPDVYLLALERLGLDAQDCIAFEDSENGLRSATAAQLRTVITTSHYTLDQDFSDAEIILPNLDGFNAQSLL